METDTIVARATPRGSSAIACIRLSGADAWEITAHTLSRPEAFEKARSNEIALHTMRGAGKKAVDEVTVIKYRGPRSYTGENMVEIFCHGGQIVIQNIMAALARCGARQAQPGEFTRRAFLNGKTCLIRAEAMNSLISSRTQKEYENAIRNYTGSAAEVLNKWSEQCREIVLQTEALIEFGEEDAVQGEISEKKIIHEIRNMLSRVIEHRDNYKKIRKNSFGATVPIVGPPNAGKSTVFNMLVDEERSIVHETAGTTRDAVSEYIRIENIPVTVIDTAGIGNGNEEIERIGIKKAWEYINRSTIIVWVTPADRPFASSEEELVQKKQAELVCIINKTDLAPGDEKKRMCRRRGIPCIQTTMTGRKKPLRGVCRTIEKKLKKIEISGAPHSIIQNARQEGIIEKLIDELKSIEEGESIEIIAFRMRKAMECLREYGGESTPQQILDDIFSRMCIGK